MTRAQLGDRPVLRMMLACFVWLLAGRTRTPAQEVIGCGFPVQRHLDSGALNSYQISVAAGSKVEIDVTDISGTIGPLKLSGAGQETCSGTLLLTGPTSATLAVSACSGNDYGDYTITANVVTQGADNCGAAMPCGVVPHGRRFGRAGDVDAYTFAGTQGDIVTLAADDITGGGGNVRMRLFDPSGTPVDGADACSPVRNLRLPSTGTYTVLVSACGLPGSSLYRLSFESPSCPAGPEITHLGVAQADGTPLVAGTFDREGRPLYLTSASGFFLVIEGRPGRSGEPVGRSAYNFNLSNPSVLPDLQVLLSRPLGDGSAAVCDNIPPDQGGVPAVPSLDYATSQAVANATNDFGCRVDDGTGRPQAVTAADACTFFPDVTYHFVDPSSTLQFCAQIARAWSFARGLTIVEARTRDIAGIVGPAQQIVVQVGTARCVGDCNGDFQITVDEVLTSVGIALGNLRLDRCPSADVTGDGIVTVDELLAAVSTTLNGCP